MCFTITSVTPWRNKYVYKVVSHKRTSNLSWTEVRYYKGRTVKAKAGYDVGGPYGRSKFVVVTQAKSEAGIYVYKYAKDALLARDKTDGEHVIKLLVQRDDFVAAGLMPGIYPPTHVATYRQVKVIGDIK